MTNGPADAERERVHDQDHTAQIEAVKQAAGYPSA